jgi:hypothetical protein
MEMRKYIEVRKKYILEYDIQSRKSRTQEAESESK